MPRLILLLAIGLALWIAYQRISSLPPNKRKGAYLTLGLGTLVVIVTIGVLSGRMHWLGAAITGLLVGMGRLLPVLARLFPVLQWFHQQRSTAAGGSGGQSTVETPMLRMELDHDSGDLDGVVLQGPLQGQRLDQLDRQALESLLAECRASDADSTRLLESYLARRFGGDWGSAQQAAPADGNMTESEALAILGLGEDPTQQDIIDAHRRLMQKLHPDRGGNDYLAAKLNQAKDLLLG